MHDKTSKADEMKVLSTKLKESEVESLREVVKECHEWGLIDSPTIAAFLEFTIRYWVPHHLQARRHFADKMREVLKDVDKVEQYLKSPEYHLERTNEQVEGMIHNVESLGPKEAETESPGPEIDEEYLV